MSANSRQSFYKIAENISEINFGPNGLALVEVSNKIITIATHKNELFACSKNCPHAGGLLADGYIDTLGNIVCPLHNYKFSLKTGRNVSSEGYFLKTYPVLQKEDGIYIQLNTGGLF